MRVSVHYYSRHVGDYAKDTAHLSLIEHGVYTLLLDRYYATERPIPQDQAYRVARARTTDERKAVDSVLSEFFALTDAGWSQDRCDAEIAKYRDKQDKAKRSASARWGKAERNANAMRTHSERNARDDANGMLTNNQEPITIIQEQELKSTVHPAAAQGRFPEFWAAYPNKKSRQQAEKAWKRLKLDARCDELIAHVRTMQAQDDGWRRGFIPMGSTYLNQARWEDEPKLPYATASPQPSHTRTAAETLLNGTSHAQRTLDQRRDPPRLGQAAEPTLARLPAG